MATYSPNFTARYKLRYSCFNAQYQMQFRAVGNQQAPLPSFLDWVKSFLDATAVFRFNSWQVLQAEYAPVGSDTFLPATAPVVIPGTASQANRTEAFQAVYLSFGGRSTLGNPTRVFLYGVDIDMLSGATTNADFRLNRAESVGINSAITALENSAGVWAASDGLPVAFVKPYANLGVNAYRQRKRRG